MNNETNSRVGKALPLCSSIKRMKSLQGQRKYHLNNSVEMQDAYRKAFEILEKQGVIIEKMRKFNINSDKFVGTDRTYIELSQQLLKI